MSEESRTGGPEAPVDPAAEEGAELGTPEANGHEPPSMFDRLKAQYAEATEERRTTIPIVPGRFNGNLVARYRPVDWSEIRKKIRRAARGGQMGEEQELEYGASVIAAACETILIRLEDGGPLVPLHTANKKWRDGEPVRYDSRLCEALGIEVNPGLPARSIARLVFKNPAALDDHFAELNAWLKELTPGEDEDEDDGGRPT